MAQFTSVGQANGDEKFNSKNRHLFDIGPEDHTEILRIMKKLDFPKSVLKKSCHEMTAHIKSNDFQNELKVAVNKHFNRAVYN